MNRYQIFKLKNLYFGFNDEKALTPVSTSYAMEKGFIEVENTQQAYNMIF